MLGNGDISPALMDKSNGRDGQKPKHHISKHEIVALISAIKDS